MSSNIECPCGHTVRVPDELVNTRVKCTVCGELLSTAAARPVEESPWEAEQVPVESPNPNENSSATSPPSTESESVYEKQKPSTASSRPWNASNFHAKGGFLFAGLPTPSLLYRIFGDTAAGTCPY